MAGGVISTGNLPRLLEYGVREIWDRVYNEHDVQWVKIFKEMDSNRAYELGVQFEGFAPAPIKPQGQGIVYDSETQGFVPKFVMNTIAKGFEVTKEAFDDNLYDLFDRGAKDLAFAFRQTEEILGASTLNNGFDSNYTMQDGDGKPLFATDHPLGPTDTGTSSNKLTVAAALSEVSVEDLLIQVNQAVDARGNKIAIQGVRLVVPPALQFQADRILQSPLQPGTTNNDINALMNRRMLPDGYCVNNYLDSSKAYFIITECPSGLIRFTRQSIEFERDRDFNTSNFRFKAMERYVYGWMNFRGAYASEGI